MKYKNYKSAIHNFIYSFISNDYTRSGRLAVNILLDLHSQGLETKATIDFINKTISPEQSYNKGSEQLLEDYIMWLSVHFSNHNCDFSKLEKLETTLWINFNKSFSPNSMPDTIEFAIKTSTNWKVEGRENNNMEISKVELINKHYLKTGIPEIK